MWYLPTASECTTLLRAPTSARPCPPHQDLLPLRQPLETAPPLAGKIGFKVSFRRPFNPSHSLYPTVVLVQSFRPVCFSSLSVSLHHPLHSIFLHLRSLYPFCPPLIFRSPSNFSLFVKRATPNRAFHIPKPCHFPLSPPFHHCYSSFRAFPTIRRPSHPQAPSSPPNSPLTSNPHRPLPPHLPPPTHLRHRLGSSRRPHRLVLYGTSPPPFPSKPTTPSPFLPLPTPTTPKTNPPIPPTGHHLRPLYQRALLVRRAIRAQRQGGRGRGRAVAAHGTRVVYGRG